jgi:pentatricopeptide repeat protein
MFIFVFSLMVCKLSPRCKPDAETYNALIHAHARMGQWRWALNIMDDMLRASVKHSLTLVL